MSESKDSGERASVSMITVGKYQLSTNVAYDKAGHFWVGPAGSDASPNVARIGFDPLGHETSGDLVAVSFDPDGTVLGRGSAFGTLEAAKYVGPLKSPVAGKVLRHNPAVAENPGLVAEAPFENWLVEIELSDVESTDDLLRDPEEIATWFAAEIKRFDEDGMIAQ